MLGNTKSPQEGKQTEADLVRYYLAYVAKKHMTDTNKERFDNVSDMVNLPFAALKDLNDLKRKLQTIIGNEVDLPDVMQPVKNIFKSHILKVSDEQRLQIMRKILVARMLKAELSSPYMNDLIKIQAGIMIKLNQKEEFSSKDFGKVLKHLNNKYSVDYLQELAPHIKPHGLDFSGVVGLPATKAIHFSDSEAEFQKQLAGMSTELVRRQPHPGPSYSKVSDSKSEPCDDILSKTPVREEFSSAHSSVSTAPSVAISSRIEQPVKVPVSSSRLERFAAKVRGWFDSLTGKTNKSHAIQAVELVTTTKQPSGQISAIKSTRSVSSKRSSMFSGFGFELLGRHQDKSVGESRLASPCNRQAGHHQQLRAPRVL